MKIKISTFHFFAKNLPMPLYDEKVIKSIVHGFMNFVKSIMIPVSSENMVRSLITYLRYESTILFHVGEINYIFYSSRKEAVLYPRYHYSKKEYDRLVYQLTVIVEKIRNQVCTVDSQYQRELRMHDALCRNISYSDDGEQSHSIIGPLLFHRGVCDGLSKATKVLLQECGIVSHVINGTAKSSCDGQYEPHAWNVVCIDKKWYHLDVTFDNTISQNDIRYDYFNLSTSEIIRDHDIEKTTEFSSIQCPNDDDYYVATGVYFTSPVSITEYLSKCFAQRIPCIQIRVARSIDKSAILRLFSQELKTLNCRIVYEESVNEIRNVYSWRITYI